MQAIATLIQDDPFLKLSVVDRLALKKARRARLWTITAKLEPAPQPEPEPVTIEPIFSMGAWIARQKDIHTPYETWFSLESEINPFEQKPPKIADIQRASSRFYGIRQTELIADRRTANVVKPRQVAMFLCKKLTLHSLPEIGRRFGGRDHTTVLHAVRKIEGLCAISIKLRDEVESIRSMIVRAA